MSNGKIIDIEGKTISQILAQQYDVDYYQRTYKWEKQQMVDLLEDLYNSFWVKAKNLKLELSPGESVETVDFPHYFLGTYVISNMLGKNFIVDGQQRLTSLTLLFIYLKNIEPLYGERQASSDILGLISSSRNGGAEVFNINIQDNIDDLKALRNKDFTRDTPIGSRYRDIVEYFGDRLTSDPAIFYYFLYWLRDNVLLAEIRTYSPIEAYTIFETMNDRGLSLSESEMLKGWILSRINEEKRKDAVPIWNNIISNLCEGYEEQKDRQSNIDRFFADVIRSKYMSLDKITKNTVENGNVFNLANQYYRWMKSPENEMGLSSEESFWDFLRELEYLSEWYLKLDKLSSMDTNDTINLWHLAYRDTDKIKNLRSMKSVFLSAIPSRDDYKNEKEIIKIMDTIAKFLDTVSTRQLWSRAKTDITSTHQMFYIKAFRNRELASICYSAYSYFTKEDIFSYSPNPSMLSNDRKNTRVLLLRMTDYVHEVTGEVSSLMRMRGKNKCDIEHVLSVNQSNHKFFDGLIDDFEEWRNRLGALIVLPIPKNRSYGDMPYEEKIKKYYADNKVAALLSPQLYDTRGDVEKNNPGIRKLKTQHELKFRTYEKFGKEEIRERNGFYGSLAKNIWNEDWFIKMSGFKEENIEASLSKLEEYIKKSDLQSKSISLIEYAEKEVPVVGISRQERAQNVYNEVISNGEDPLPLTYVRGDTRVEGVTLRSNGRFYFKRKSHDTPGAAISALAVANNVVYSTKNPWDDMKVSIGGEEKSLKQVEEEIEGL